MTIYDDMRGYVHTHDRNGWFDVATETTPMYQMVDKADAENAKLRELATEAIRLMQADGPDCGLCKHYSECWTSDAMDYSPSGCVICNEARELGVEVDGFGGLLARELGKERLVRRAKE